MICTTLRKKGTNKFYWYAENPIISDNWYLLDFPELMDGTSTRNEVVIYYSSITPLPDDAELIKVEVKIIEDEN